MEDSETFSKLNSFTFPQTGRLDRVDINTCGTVESKKEVGSESSSDSSNKVEVFDQSAEQFKDFSGVTPSELSPKSTIQGPSKHPISNSKRFLTETLQPPQLSSSYTSLNGSHSPPVIPYPARRHSNIIVNHKRQNSMQQSISSLSPITLPDRTFGKSQEYTTGSKNDVLIGELEHCMSSPPTIKRASSWSTKGPIHRRSLSISSNPLSIDSLTTTPLASMETSPEESNSDCQVPAYQPNRFPISNPDGLSKKFGSNNVDTDMPSLSPDHFDDENTRIMKTPSSGSSYTLGEAEAINLRRPSIVYIVTSPTNLEVDLNVIEK